MSKCRCGDEDCDQEFDKEGPADLAWDNKPNLHICDCMFSEYPTEEGEHFSHSWHYLRECWNCGNQWHSLHCPHDGYQNYCYECGARAMNCSECGELPEECPDNCPNNHWVHLSTDNREGTGTIALTDMGRARIAEMEANVVCPH